MKSLKAVSSWGLRAFAALWLLVHFTLTVLFCFPLNPLKMDLEPVLYGTIGHYFPQNWSLFAPNPINVNQSLFVRCLDEGEAKVYEASHTLPTEGWHDATMPLFAAHQQNRLSAYDRLSRPQTNVMKAFMHGGQELQSLAVSCQNGEKDACAIYDDRLARVRAATGPILGRIGSEFCREVDPRPALSHVALRIHDTPTVPWSKRYEAPTLESKDYQVGTYPIDSTLPVVGVFKGVM